MTNLKDLMEKYGSVTTENGLMDGVEVDMDPTVGVVETIINGENEEIVKEAIESAAKDAEELEVVAADAEELEETVETEEKEEEATTESAIRIMDKINQTLEKHGYKSDEDKEAMGYSVSSLNTESAQSFPSATKDAAVKAGKVVIEKIKDAVKWIIEKVKAIVEKIKDGILAAFGHNATVAKKLKGIISGLSEDMTEGKEFKGDFGSKFPLAHELNASTVIDSMISSEAESINKVIKLFIDGCATKSLEKFNKLDGISTSESVGKMLDVEKGILIGIDAGKVSAIAINESGNLFIKSKQVEGKAPALDKPLSNSDLIKICEAVITNSEKTKTFVESTNASFDSIKNIKVEDEEFAKSAKIELNVSMLTSAKIKMLSAAHKQPKTVLQFVAANVAVKAKKA